MAEVTLVLNVFQLSAAGAGAGLGKDAADIVLGLDTTTAGLLNPSLPPVQGERGVCLNKPPNRGVPFCEGLLLARLTERYFRVNEAR